MEHDLVLEGRVVAPGGLLEAEVGVSDGMIVEIGHGLKGARKIRSGRSLIFPGFVDIHVHLREPGWEQKEDFRTGTRAAVHGGVTTVVDMPNNPAPTTTAGALELKTKLASEKAKVDVKFYGGIAVGRLDRVKELAAGVVGYKLYLSETTGTGAFPEGDLGGAFESAWKVGKPVSLHCEKQSIIDGRRKELTGVEAPDVHCDVRPPEAEVESVRAAIEALRKHTVRANICHASTGEAVGLVRKARLEGVKVRCEATLHHIYFNRRAMLDSKLLKTNPPLRMEDDRQALLGGVRDGGVSFLVTDHAPHLIQEKVEGGAAGVPGLDDYCHVVSWLMREQGVDPMLISKVAAWNPSRYLRMEDRGEITVGKRADFTVLDPRSEEKVSNDRAQTKCGWSPYEGQEFPGRARWVVRKGEVLMDDFELAV